MAGISFIGADICAPPSCHHPFLVSWLLKVAKAAQSGPASEIPSMHQAASWTTPLRSCARGGPPRAHGSPSRAHTMPTALQNCSGAPEGAVCCWRFLKPCVLPADALHAQRCLQCHVLPEYKLATAASQTGNYFVCRGNLFSAFAVC